MASVPVNKQKRFEKLELRDGKVAARFHHQVCVYFERKALVNDEFSNYRLSYQMHSYLHTCC